MRWFILICAAGVLFFGGVYIARRAKPDDGGRSPSQLGSFRVGFRLLAAIACFISVDAIIFHSGIYSRVLAPASHAGQLYQRVEAENRRAPGGGDVLMIGDSRVVQGFSVDAANARASSHGLTFVDGALGSSTPRVWYYLLREIDPSANRYRAIV